MARFAPVCPLPVAFALDNASLLGGYHLLLAHDVLEGDNAEYYRSLYRYGLKSYKDRLVIMDNSVVELGYAMPFEKVLMAAVIAGADYIVAQDSFLKAAETIKASNTFLLDARMAANGGATVPPLMGVVQGQTIAEVIACADFYAGNKEFRGIAVPRCLTPIFGSRIGILLELQKRYPTRFDCWHLLGFSEDVFDDMASARLPFVTGIDSAAPIRGGIKGMLMQLPTWDVGARGDYWQTKQDHAGGQMRYLRYNIKLIQSLIETHPH